MLPTTMDQVREWAKFYYDSDPIVQERVEFAVFKAPRPTTKNKEAKGLCADYEKMLRSSIFGKTGVAWASRVKDKVTFFSAEDSRKLGLPYSYFLCDNASCIYSCFKLLRHKDALLRLALCGVTTDNSKKINTLIKRTLMKSLKKHCQEVHTRFDAWAKEHDIKLTWSKNG